MVFGLRGVHPARLSAVETRPSFARPRDDQLSIFLSPTSLSLLRQSEHRATLSGGRRVRLERCRGRTDCNSSAGLSLLVTLTHETVIIAVGTRDVGSGDTRDAAKIRKGQHPRRARKVTVLRSHAGAARPSDKKSTRGGLDQSSFYRTGGHRFVGRSRNGVGAESFVHPMSVVNRSLGSRT